MNLETERLILRDFVKEDWELSWKGYQTFLISLLKERIESLKDEVKSAGLKQSTGLAIVSITLLELVQPYASVSVSE